ncbi:unnamed protein product [Blepharisma stoltei]|uniref:Cyclin-like domain-containing protein n=1 Tax=Blepharisma stoltei TaxID=1481888 RepID=A0AAU9IZU6_9CILI|nr:unnamed protein product [Blepharisma stoltei]
MSSFNSNNNDKENLPLLQARKPNNYGRQVLVSVDSNFYNTTLPDLLLHHFKNSPDLSTKESLLNHSITINHRSRLLNWMIEVTSSFGCSDNVFFLTVRLMDTYLKLTEGLENNDLHLIGVTCMFIASKFDEVTPLKLKVIHENILFSHHSEEEVRALEGRILEVLSFKVNIQTCLDTLGCLKSRYDENCSISNIARIVLYLVQFYYNAQDYDPRQQAVTAFIMAAFSERRIDVVRTILSDHDLIFPEIEEIMSKFYCGVEEFEKNFPDYKSPMLFLNFNILHQDGLPLFEFNNTQ